MKAITIEGGGMRFTPAPWTCNFSPGEGVWVEAQNGRVLCFLNGQNGEAKKLVGALIIVLPDLLEALEAVDVAIVTLPDQMRDALSVALLAAHHQAHTALMKAGIAIEAANCIT